MSSAPQTYSAGAWQVPGAAGTAAAYPQYSQPAQYHYYPGYQYSTQYPYGYDYYSQGYQAPAGAPGYSYAQPPQPQPGHVATTTQAAPPAEPTAGTGAYSTAPQPPAAPPQAAPQHPAAAPSTAPTAQPAPAYDAQAAQPAASYDLNAYAYYNYYGQTAGYNQPYAGYPQYPAGYQYAYTSSDTSSATVQQSQPSYSGHASTQPQPPVTPQPPSSAPAPAAPTPPDVSTASLNDGKYNAVPPPPSLAAPPSQNRLGFSIRPQYNKKPATVVNAPATATTTTTTASAISTATAAATSVAKSPAYTRAAAPSPVVNSHPAPAAAAAGPAAKPYPASFMAWVERCFSRCRSDADRQIMKELLSTKVKQVDAEQRMWLTDWDTEPMCSLSDSTVSTARTLSGSASASTKAPSPSSRGYKRDCWDDQSVSEGNNKYQDLWQRGNKHNKNNKVLMKKQRRAAAAAVAGSGSSDDESTGLGGGVKHLSLEKQRRAQRAGRFGDGRAQGGLQSWTPRSSQWAADEYQEDDNDLEVDLSTLAIRGTCTELEKSYFRLTAAPDPSTVRPEPVLRKALARLVRLLHEGAVNYFYACDQFKGLRQDCTVQHLRNELAVEVYEAHGRAALEYGDLAEFNQCQTQLRHLYAEGISGNAAEFTAYMLLYETVHARGGLNKALLSTMKHVLATSQLTSAPEVRHALQVRSAVMALDYGLFFQLYASAPHLGRAIMDAIAGKMRWAALNVLVKAYKTSLPVSFLAHLLGFMPAAAQQEVAFQALPGCKRAFYAGKAAAAASKEEGTEACVAWLLAHGAVHEESADQEQGAPHLDVKASLGKLFVPEEPKVAHGDENLSLDDFLAQACRKTAVL